MYQNAETIHVNGSRNALERMLTIGQKLMASPSKLTTEQFGELATQLFATLLVPASAEVTAKRVEELRNVIAKLFEYAPATSASAGKIEPLTASGLFESWFGVPAPIAGAKSPIVIVVHRD